MITQEEAYLTKEIEDSWIISMIQRLQIKCEQLNKQVFF